MSNNFTTSEHNSPEAKRRIPPLLSAAIHLGLKLLAIAALLLFLFGVIFGFKRVSGVQMAPSLTDGDLVLYNRRDTSYIVSDVIVFHKGDQTQVSRVVAVAGDTVNIKDGYLLVNGAVIQEKNIYTVTDRYAEGINFPVTVGDGEVFVLGDNRPGSEDSRIFGCVRIRDTCGTVFLVLRQRGI